MLESLEPNAADLVACRARIDRKEAELDDSEHGMKPTLAQYRKLEKKLKAEILKESPEWEVEQRYL